MLGTAPALDVGAAVAADALGRVTVRSTGPACLGGGRRWGRACTEVVWSAVVDAVGASPADTDSGSEESPIRWPAI